MLSKNQKEVRSKPQQKSRMPLMGLSVESRKVTEEKTKNFAWKYVNRLLNKCKEKTKNEYNRTFLNSETTSKGLIDMQLEYQEEKKGVGIEEIFE